MTSSPPPARSRSSTSNYIAARNPAEAAYQSVHPRLAKGRDLGVDSAGEVVLGSAIAAELRETVGDIVDLPVWPADATSDFVNHTFAVVGVLAPTRTMPDTGCLRQPGRRPDAAEGQPAGGSASPAGRDPGR